MGDVPATATRRGYVDHTTRDLVTGWAYDAATPDTPVVLQILHNGAVIGRVLANRHRADLVAAGIGRGQHAFEFPIAGGLPPTLRHVIDVRYETDGVGITHSPFVIEAATSLDAALQHAIADAIPMLTRAADQDDALHFLMTQIDRLVQMRADTDADLTRRRAHQQARRRWGPAWAGGADPQSPAKRALVIDDQIPVTGRDAGSDAILSHMRALRRLGYAVSLVAAEQMGPSVGGPEAADVTLCTHPFYASVEDVLRRQAGCFDVVYLHRADMAARYLALARRWNPRACMLYSVADLHHVRLLRQSVVEDRPELRAQSHRMRLVECHAAWLADAVITHSTDEACLLRTLVPRASVHHVPWDIPVRRPALPFAARQGVAFIGGYGHAPNIDAAYFLAEVVMPLVWKTSPAIQCRLVGSAMPEAIRRLARPGVVAVGQVADLQAEVFDHVRLTVAPLRYGAGVKGKVLESFAAGVPCVMSPVAAEGLLLPAALRALVGRDAIALAAIICRLHDDQAAHEPAAAAAVDHIRRHFSQDDIDQKLRNAIQGTNLPLPAPGMPTEACASV